MKAPTHPNIAVVGAGAAGIAAARQLLKANCNVVVLEARERLGGRAFTNSAVASYPLDLGCEWLHSADRNPLVKAARRLGLTVDSSPPPWDKTPLNTSMTRMVERDFEKSVGRFYARLDAAARAPHDRAASDLLDPECQWNPLIDAISTYVSGVELDKISVVDGENYEDTETDWRVVEGYGTLISRLAAKLTIYLSANVHTIDHANTRIKIATSGGSLEADAVIVTVPTNVIASGLLRFIPDLPRKCEAAAHLPLGVANKIFFFLDRAEEFERDTNLYGAIDRVATGNYYLHISGRPLVEGFFGGALALDLEREGFAAFADFATNELVGVMGSAFRQRLHPLVSSAWGSDPFSLGSYSYAEPDHAGDRAVLEASVDGRIFFAGEACSKYHFSTAHGAYRSGRKAARAVLRAFRRI